MGQFWMDLAEWALTGLIGFIAMLMWRQLQAARKRDADRRQETEAHNQRQAEQLKLVKQGQQMQLRLQLIQLHEKWIVQKGYMPLEAKQLWLDMCRVYESLGENGVIDSLRDDVKHAHIAPGTLDPNNK